MDETNVAIYGLDNYINKGILCCNNNDITTKVLNMYITAIYLQFSRMF